MEAQWAAREAAQERQRCPALPAAGARATGRPQAAPPRARPLTHAPARGRRVAALTQAGLDPSAERARRRFILPDLEESSSRQRSTPNGDQPGPPRLSARRARRAARVLAPPLRGAARRACVAGGGGPARQGEARTLAWKLLPMAPLPPGGEGAGGAPRTRALADAQHARAAPRRAMGVVGWVVPRWMRQLRALGGAHLFVRRPRAPCGAAAAAVRERNREQYSVETGLAAACAMRRRDVCHVRVSR